MICADKGGWLNYARIQRKLNVKMNIQSIFEENKASSVPVVVYLLVLAFVGKHGLSGFQSSPRLKE